MQARSTAIGGGPAGGAWGGLSGNFFEIRVQNPAFWALLAVVGRKSGPAKA